MDTTRALVKLPFFGHSLVSSPRFIYTTCGGCNLTGNIYGGYTCSTPMCVIFYHKNCAEAPSKINHSSHPQHPLLLTKLQKSYTCDVCGHEHHIDFDSYISYHCSICEFNVHITCGLKPPSLAIQHSMCHDHPLVFFKKQKKEFLCEVCKESIDGPSYTCFECDVYFHVECIQLGKEVNHPCHSNHSLKLMTSESLMNDVEKTCSICKDEEKEMVYRCPICNFTSCIRCTVNPPPLFIDHPRTHEHPLTRLSKKITFTCNHCGMEKDISSYMCIHCDFVIHGTCIGLPHVININRHDHRISFRQHLGVGYLNCGVCRKSADQYYGGFACSICPNYVVHSSCATNHKVWDNAELEEIPEIIENILPFKLMGDGLICHVSHKNHLLKLHKDNINHDQLTQCKACNYTIGFDPIYSCTKCCFILHEKCASLPLKKRLVFDNIPFTLIPDASSSVLKVLDCKFCGIFSTGFKYASLRKVEVDIHCGSLSEPLVHKSHPDPLYFYQSYEHYCSRCENTIDSGYMLRCDACDFDLCLSCSNIPETIRYSNHEHPISLCCEEDASDKYWCDICEKEINLKRWFYTCDDCGVTIHVECILGDFSRLPPGHIIDYFDYKYEVVLNNRNTRPQCYICRSRCKFSIILKDLKVNDYICSLKCLLYLYDGR